MKSINLLKHVLVREETDEDLFQEYAKIESNYPEKITRQWEEEDLKGLVNEFKRDYSLWDHFYYSFKIAQISKEFDLIRFGYDYIINIELKHESTIEKITKQLIQNAYYLEFIGLPILSFTYVAMTRTLYQLIDDHIKKVSFHTLEEVLRKQEVKHIGNINKLFTPSIFLISPFIEPEKFVKGQYFLTDQQRMIKNELVDMIERNEKTYYGISGDYGTGKTLLVYDLTRSLMNKYKVLILHCGIANKAQEALNKHGFHILSLNQMKHSDIYDLVLVDEAQRMSEEEITHLMHYVDSHDCQCILFYDPLVLLKYRGRSKVVREIIPSIEDIRIFTLTHRVRINEQMAKFISWLFDHDELSDVSLENVEITHFMSYQDGLLYGQYLENDHCALIDLTLDEIKNNEENEYRDMAVIIGEDFYYDEEGRLCAPQEKLLQLYYKITAVRGKLSLIMIHNHNLFAQVLSINH